jgi:membrane-associated phospholipid phosphatase
VIISESMHLFGNLGHVALLGPLSLAVILYLVAIGARRDALAFAAALAVCLVATLAAKLLFDVCDSRIANVESPSGHESYSAIVYGGIALLVATGRPARQQMAIYAATALLILLIGIGRVASRAHTPQEVVLGLLIGIAAAFLFRRLRGDAHSIAVPWRALALLSPFALALAFGALVFLRHWTPEDFLATLGRQFGAHYGLCI